MSDGLGTRQTGSSGSQSSCVCAAIGAIRSRCTIVKKSRDFERPRGESSLAAILFGSGRRLSDLFGRVRKSRGGARFVALRDSLTSSPAATYRGGTSVPGHIPAPIQIGSAGDTDIEARAREILTLSKMNWNSSDGITQLPVTLLFAKRFGEIMTALSDNVTPKPNLSVSHLKKLMVASSRFPPLRLGPAKNYG
jgi:hypothetical protein